MPFDAIISEDLIIRDPNYTLQEADIVNEVKDGYIIKVEGKYYLYLKDAKHTSNVRSVDEIARQKKLHKTKEEGDSGKSSATKSSKTRDFSQPSKSLAAGKTAADLAGASYQGKGDIGRMMGIRLVRLTSSRILAMHLSCHMAGIFTTFLRATCHQQNWLRLRATGIAGRLAEG